MDKYEYKLRLDELKTLVGEQKYEEAAELSDELNWKKVKNVNSLMLAGEAYEKVGRFEDAREVLLAAYERSPIGRMIIYRLAELAIRVKNFDEAREYYDEFIDVAPHDNMRYVLRYEMMKAEGVPLAERIALLEEFKEEEYTEKWAFELAYLYHKAGDSAKCVDACDELVLWFGDGMYVEKALELKMLYQPLNKIQEQKYRDFRMKRTGQVEVHTGERLNSGEIIAETIRIPDVSLSTEKYNTVNLQAEIAKSMEQIANATGKDEVSDSMDIIKKMVEEIPYLQIDEEEETKKKNPEEEVHIETDEEIDSDLTSDFERYLAEENDGQMSLMMPEQHPGTPQITGQLSIDEVLAEWEKTRRAAEAAIQDNEERRLESEKQRALKEAREVLDRLTTVLPQLEAGMTPKELLEEKYTKKADILSAEEEAKASRLVENVNALLQQEIDRLQDDLQAKPPLAKPSAAGMEELTAPAEAENMEEPFPEIEMPPEVDSNALRQLVKPDAEPESPKTEEPEMKLPEIEIPADIKKDLEKEAAADTQPEPEEKPAVTERPEETEKPEKSENLEKPEKEETPKEPEEEKLPEILLPSDIEKAVAAAALLEKEKKPDSDVMPDSPEKWIPKNIEDIFAPETPPVKTPQKEVRPFTPPKLSKESEELPKEPEVEKTPEAAEKKKLGDSQPLPELVTPESLFTTKELPTKHLNDKPAVPQEPAAPEKPDTPAKAEKLAQSKKELSREEKEVFSYFMDVDGMERQIQNTVSHVSSQYISGGRFSGHVLIQGVAGNGKTTLATDLVKVIQKRSGHKFKGVASIEAAALNRKDIGKLFEKLQGGALMIGNAGYLSANTAGKLADAMKEDASGIMVIMEDTNEGLNSVMSSCPALANRFLERIVIPAFTSDELVKFAKAYAREEEYEIDEMAVLALYDRISKIRRLDEATTLAEVKEIVDKAIDRAERVSMRNLFGGRRTSEDGYVLLQEKDFN